MHELNIKALPDNKEKSAVWKLHDASIKYGIEAIKKHNIVWRQYLAVKQKRTKPKPNPPEIIFRCELRHRTGNNYEFVVFRKVEDLEQCLGQLVLVDVPLFKTATASPVNVPIYQTENPFSCHSYQSSRLSI